MHLGIDFDGTITDVAALQRAYVARRWGIELEPHQVMRGGAAPVIGEDRYNTMGRWMWGPLTAFTPPHEDALSILGGLANEHDVTVVTARHAHEAAFARRWLASRGLGVRLVNTSRAPKAAICAALGIDLLLDDDIVHHHPGLDDAGTIPVLFEQAHHHDLVRPDGLRSVGSWREFASLVEALEGAAGADGR
jgi:hypothetical protein